jgi:Asp-tRNA(Asn)/Glu-tRNA(Gln) amidotransferase A subunit family amidase
MADEPLWMRTAAETVALVRAGDVSPVDVVRSSLDRIAEVQPQLNCFVLVREQQALEAARAAERAVLAGEPLGPLHGVPVAIKDLTPTAGDRTTRGSHAFEHNVADRDSVIAERLRAAGAILVGKTTTPEFAYSSFTRSPLWGPTRNPWDPDLNPGGSSGGSAVAVATGCVPLAEGTDMGGSVRIPASYCGIVGLKPSLGRIPLDILPSSWDTIQHFGPLARTIDDARLFLLATAGYDPRDAMSQTADLDWSAPIPANVEGMRLAYDIDLAHYVVDPQVERETRAAIDALADAGAIVEEVEIPWTREFADAWGEHWSVYLAAWFGDVLPEYGDKMDPTVRRLIEHGLKMDAVTFKRLEIVRQEGWEQLAAIHAEHDAFLCPTMAQLPPPIDVDEYALYRTEPDGRYHALDMTSQFNFTSPCPALSVPAGWSDEGLPVGLQIVTRPHRDDEALRIGAALERVRPWAERRPEV